MRWRNSLGVVLFAAMLWSMSALGQEPPIRSDALQAADTTAVPSSGLTVPDSLPPLVNPVVPQRFDPRANMVWIDGCDITWTLPDAAGRRRSQGGPKRSTPGFFLDRTEVTNRDFAQFLSFDDSNSVYYDPRMDIVEISHGQYRAKSGRESYPVAWVDWTAAFAFAKMAGKSLPTEDEWICAALAGRPFRADSIQYTSDDSTQCNRLNTAIFPRAVAVASFARGANAAGAFDLAGNLAEWTITEEVTPLPDGKTHSWIVVKGGSFLDCPAGMTIFSRAVRDRRERLSSVGFRCVLREQQKK